MWQDKRANQYDIYCHHLNSQGFGNNVVAAEDELEYSIYPNPTNGFLQLSSDKLIGEIRIYNTTGEIIQIHRGLSLYNKALNIEFLPAGLYVIEVQLGYDTSRRSIVKM